MRILKTLLMSILAGAVIGIGGIVFLSTSTENRYIGAVAFSIGLFSICEFGFSLYTGKIGKLIGYIKEKDKASIIDLPFIVVGNYVGCLFISGIMHLTRVYDKLLAVDKTLVETKLGDTWWSVLVLAFMCGIMIYLGVENFGRTSNNFSKIFGLVICVFVFIMSSFEHSIADIFYLAAAAAFTPQALGFLCIVLIGNSLGGMILPACAGAMRAQGAL